MKGWRRFLLTLASLGITGYVYIEAKTVDPYFAGLTSMAWAWFFQAHQQQITDPGK